MHKVAHGDGGITLPVGMTGRASRAKAAVGDKPVFAYMASLPQPQRDVTEAVDALARKTSPGNQRFPSTTERCSRGERRR